MKKLLILLLLLCAQKMAWAEEINIKIAPGCKMSSRHSRSFSSNFDSVILNVTGADSDVLLIIKNSTIKIAYQDGKHESVPLSALPPIDSFRKIDENSDVHRGSLTALLQAKNLIVRIKEVEVTIACGDSSLVFTISNAKAEDTGPVIRTPIVCDCSYDSIIGTRATQTSFGCDKGRKVTDHYSKANWFGEDSIMYTKNHKTYVYDFNRDIVKRGFFKIYQKRGETKLTADPVNLSTEYLSPYDIVNFKVVHINRFMYDVSIADTLVEFNSEPSPLFSRFFLGDSNLLANLTTAFTNGFNSDSRNMVSQNSSAEGRNDTMLLCKIRCFIRKYNGLQAKMLQAYNPCSEFPCCAAEGYHELANDLLDIKLMSAQDEPFFNKTLKELNEQKKKRDNHKVKSAELETVQKQLTEVKKKKADDLTAAEKTLLNRETALTKEIMTADEFKTLEEQIAANEKLLEPYERLQSLNESLPKISEIRQMILFLNNMVEQNQTYMKEITSLRGNMLDLTLNITEKDSIGRIAPVYSNFSQRIELPIVGRLFPSFSSGSFIGFSKSLKNKTYEWRKLPAQNNLVTDTATYELSESGYSLPPMGIAALVNAEIKIIPDLGLGLSAGVGLTLESKPRVAYLAGGSLFLGNKRQLALTCGIMAVQVEQLSNSLNVGQFTYTATGRPTISYYKELKAGGFLALSYTPFIQRPAHKR